MITLSSPSKILSAPSEALTSKHSLLEITIKDTKEEVFFLLTDNESEEANVTPRYTSEDGELPETGTATAPTHPKIINRTASLIAGLQWTYEQEYEIYDHVVTFLEIKAQTYPHIKLEEYFTSYEGIVRLAHDLGVDLGAWISVPPIANPLILLNETDRAIEEFFGEADREYAAQNHHPENQESVVRLTRWESMLDTAERSIQRRVQTSVSRALEPTSAVYAQAA